MSKPNPGRFPVRRFLRTAIVLACVFASVQTVPVAAKVPPKPKPKSRGKIVTPAPVTTIPKQKDYQLIVQGSYEFDLGDGDGERGSVSGPAIIVRVTNSKSDSKATGSGYARLSGEIVDETLNPVDQPVCRVSGVSALPISVAAFGDSVVSDDLAPIPLLPPGNVGFSLATVRTPGGSKSCPNGTITFDGSYFIPILQMASAFLVFGATGGTETRKATNQVFGQAKVSYDLKFTLTPF